MRIWKLALFLLPLMALGQGTQVDYRTQVKNGPLYYYDTVAQLPAVNCSTVTRFAVVAGALYHNTAFPPSCLWQPYSFNNVPVVTDFGCVGDGVTNDTACVQAAINAIEGNNRPLSIPAGYTFCVNSLSFTGSIVIGGGGTLKRCGMLSDSIEQGLIDIRGPGVVISNISIEGVTLTPQVQINYLQSPIESPFDSLLWRNTSILIHGGSNNTIIGPNVKINHTGGYAIWLDSRTANTSHVSIIDDTISNSRSSVCGTPGDYQYGCWTGGILWSNDGTTYSIDDLTIRNNRLLQVSGNGIWGHAPAIALQNSGVRVVGNYCEDMGLDCIQMENVRGGLVAHNTGKRIGYVSVADNTPGVPKWQPATAPYDPGHILPGNLYFSVPAVAVDTSALVTGVEYSDNNFDAINGGWYDTDGYGSGNIYPGTGTSCHFSTDPFAQKTACGPGSDGINYAYGFNMGSSNGSTLADTNVNLVGGQFNGFGGGAIHMYGCSNCKITGTSINHPASVAVPGAINYSPITYGPFTIGPTTFYPTNMEITGNTAFWSPPTPGWVVSEDATYAPFISSNSNVVHNNSCVTNTACYEFFKNPTTASSSGPQRLTSVTPGACANPSAMPYPLCNVELDMQVEGTAASSWVTRFYRNAANVGFDAFDITSDHIFTPGYVWAGSFLKPNAVPFSTYPCTGQVDNGLIWITDSTTQTAGAVISGGGSFKVLASCVDPNWVVVGGTGGGGGGGGVNPGTAGALAWYATTGSTVGPSPVSASTSCVGCAESLQFVSGTLPGGGFRPPVGSFAYGFVASNPATWDSAGNQKNLITGTGTNNFLPKFSSTFGVVNSGLQDSGTDLTTSETFTTTNAISGASLAISGAVNLTGLLAGAGGSPLCITGSVVAIGGCVSGGGGSAASYTTAATGDGQVVSAATLTAAGVGPATALAACFDSAGHVIVCDWIRDPSTHDFTFHYGAGIAVIEVTGAIGGGGGGGSPSFSAITSGANSTANMTCLGSCQISASGSGIIVATSVNGFSPGGATLTGPTSSNLTLAASGGVLTNNTLGNAATSTALDHAPTGCTNQWATGIASSGNLTCTDINRINGTLLSSLLTGLLKVTNGSGALSTAISGTDYVSPTSGTAIQKANGSGGLAPAVASDVGALGTLSNNTSGTAATATAATTTPTLCGAGFAPRGVDVNFNASGCQAVGGGGGSGTVTTFSAGALSPIFTTSVATATTTPALSFTLSSFAQNGVLIGPVSGGAGVPTVRTLAAGDISGAGTLANNTSGTAAGLTSAYIDWNAVSGGAEILNKPSIPTVTGGPCTNQAVTAISSSAVPTCNTITSAYVNNSVAVTGVDLNTSSQVVSVHLSSPLSVAMGGSGSTSPAIIGGTGISVTGTWPNQTITNTGSGIGGSGTANSMAKFTGSSAIGNSIVTDNGTVMNASGLIAANVNSNYGMCMSDGTLSHCGSMPSIGWNTAIPTGLFVGGNLPTGFPSGAVGENHLFKANGSSLVYGSNYELDMGASQSGNGFVIVATLSNNSTTPGGGGSGLYGEIQCNGCVTGGDGVAAEAHMQTPPSQAILRAFDGQCGFAASGRSPAEVGQGHTCQDVYLQTGYQTDFTNIISISTTNGSAAIVATGNPFSSGMCHGGSGCTGGANIYVGLWIVNDNSLVKPLPYIITTFTDSNHVTVNTPAGGTASGIRAYLGWNDTAAFDMVNQSGYGLVGLRVRESDTAEFETAAQFIAGGLNHPNQIQLINAPNNTNAGSTNGIGFWRAALGPNNTMPMQNAVNGYQTGEIRSDITANGSYAQGFVDIYSDQGGVLTKNARFDVNGLSLSSKVQITPTTVGGLGTCNGGAEGTIWSVTDALAPSFLVTIVGGGSTHSPVFCNGTNWVAF